MTILRSAGSQKRPKAAGAPKLKREDRLDELVDKYTSELEPVGQLVKRSVSVLDKRWFD